MKSNLIKLLACVLFSFGHCMAQDSLSIKIRHMLDVMGATKQFEAVIDNYIEYYRSEFSGEEMQKFLNEFQGEVKSQGYSELLDRVVPVYQRHLSEEEIDALIAFFSSEVGQKMVNKFPRITLEAMEEGEQLGEEIAERIMAGLEEERSQRIKRPETQDCNALRTGKFIEELEDGRIAHVERKSDQYIQEYDGQKTRYDLEWISPCSFRIIKLDKKGAQLTDQSFIGTIVDWDGTEGLIIYQNESEMDFFEVTVRLQDK